MSPLIINNNVCALKKQKNNGSLKNKKILDS